MGEGRWVGGSINVFSYIHMVTVMVVAIVIT